jgi:hypothetical protein
LYLATFCGSPDKGSCELFSSLSDCFWIFGFPSGIKKKKKNFVEDLPLNMSTKFGINWFTCLKKIGMKKFTNYDDVGR